MPDHRPRFHLTAPTGWINDPNGIVGRDGRTHVFFQRNPLAATWAPRIHWGHASSADLARWTHHPDALAPSPAGPDAGGCWSGCIVDDGGVPTAVYSGLGHDAEWGARSVCLARGDVELERWEKHPRNPVIAGPPPGVTHFRDPFVWRDGEGWSLLMGAALDGEPAALLYRSPDLVDWTYEGVAASRLETDLWTGDAWECPQLFALDGRHVLIVSVYRAQAPNTVCALACVGDYRDGRFHAELVERFDHGADCYAPATQTLEDGRRLAIGWAWEACPSGRDWAGALTIPRELTIAPHGGVGHAPAREIEALRGAPATAGRALDIAVRSAGDHPLELRVLASDAEHTRIAWDPSTGRLEVDRSRASLDPRAAGGAHGGRLELAPGEDLDLRVLVDHSIVEVFANGRLALTERVYPTREDSVGVHVEAPALRSFGAWRM